MRRISLLLLLLLVSSAVVLAQQVKYCRMIGKSVEEVIKNYGKPVYQDLSNPDMKCIFYQTKTSRTVFVANKEGVYQIQVDLSFDLQKSAQKSIDGFLEDCGSQSYEIDTVGAFDYNIRAPGVKMNLNLFENKYLGKFEVKFKADRSERK